MKKYRLFISILATIAILILGGCGMTEGNKEVKYKEEQDRMVEYLAQNYEGVEKIEFINFEKNNTTGTWSSDAIVNDIYYITFSLNGFGGEIDVTEHISRSKGKELHLKNGEEDINTSKIQKVYFEE